MPFYEYHCPNCKKGFTLMRTMAERDEPATCPDCGKFTALREVSAFSTGSGGGGFAAGGGGGGCGSGGFT